MKTRIIKELDNEVVPIHNDERGKIRDFKRFLVEGLHVVTMQPGAVRGNHVHDRDEIMCVIGGSRICEIIAEDEASGDREKIVAEGDLKTYRIKAGIKHIVRNTGNDAFYLVCFHEALSKIP